jgi:Alkylmercury lyase
MDQIAEITQSWTNGNATRSTQEDDLLTVLVWRLLVGRAISAGEAAAALGRPEEDVQRAMASLGAKRCLRLDPQGAAVAAQGLMVHPSPHCLQTAYGSIYTQCSVDAIGIPVALGIDARVEDRCALCDQPVKARISSAAEITVDPATAVLLMAQADGCVDGDIPRACHETNLFCSAGHARHWQETAATLRSAAVTLEKAAEIGKALWGQFRVGQVMDQNEAKGGT